MEQYINKSEVIAEIERLDEFYHLSKSIGGQAFIEGLLSSLNVLEVDSNDAFIEKAWGWIEDNLLSSNQQDKSRLYFEQFKKYIKGE